MNDTILSDLRILPASHIALQDISVALALQKENKTLKVALLVCAVLGGVLLIYKIKKDENGKKD
jgi:hypothetical protein